MTPIANLCNNSHVIEEAAARPHTSCRARRLESPGNHPALFSPPPVVAKTSQLSPSNSWQRVFETHWASMCCCEDVGASSAVCVRDVNTATERHPGRAHRCTVWSQDSTCACGWILHLSQPQPGETESKFCIPPPLSLPVVSLSFMIMGCYHMLRNVRTKRWSRQPPASQERKQTPWAPLGRSLTEKYAVDNKSKTGSSNISRLRAAVHKK